MLVTRWLQDSGQMSIKQIEALLYEMETTLEKQSDPQAEDLVDQLMQDSQKESTIPHYNPRTWYVEAKREDAISLLKSRPAETFLIRPKDDGTFVLSVV